MSARAGRAAGAGRHESGFGAASPYLLTEPGRPGSSEQLQFRRHANGVTLRVQVQRPDGTFFDLPATSVPVQEAAVSAERWTPQGDVVTYARPTNGAAVDTGADLWKDGIRTDRTGVLETVAADGDAVVALGGHLTLRRPGGEEFILPAVAEP